MICLFFFCVWKLSECYRLRKLKLSQNKVVVFSFPYYYSLHRKSNQLKIGWAILCDALKMTDTISIINGHMFYFDVSYRDCVEWLLFEIDMSSSSAPQFSFLFVKYSLLFLVFCLCLAFTCDCSLCTLGTHYHYITVKSVMWESRSRALLSFLQSNRDSNGINNGFNNATTNSMIVPLE